MKSNLKKLSTLLILLMIVSCYNDRFDTIDSVSYTHLINEGETIEIDTRDGSYVGRVKA